MSNSISFDSGLSFEKYFSSYDDSQHSSSRVYEQNDEKGILDSPFASPLKSPQKGSDSLKGIFDSVSFQSPEKNKSTALSSEDLQITPEPISRRHYRHISLAPSLAEPTSEKDIIMHHGYMRVLYFYMLVLTYANVALRTDKEPAPVKITLHKSEVQVGRSKTKGFQAAHSHALSGLTDNQKSRIYKELFEGGLTPHKEKTLKNLGITSEDLATLNCAQRDALTIKNIVKKYWTHNSLIKGKRIENTINATNVLPTLLNQGCDCELEKTIRAEIPEYIEACMQGRLTAEKACRFYILAIQNHFDSSIKKISNSIDHVKKFYETSKRVIEIESQHCEMDVIDPSVLVSYQEDLNELREEMAAYLEYRKNWRGLPKMKVNEHYFCEGSYPDLEQRLQKTNIRRRNTPLETLEQESQALIEALENLKKYCIYEKEGTREPPYEFFNQTFDTSTKTWRHLTEEERDERKSFHLSEPSPVKRIKRSIKRKLITDYEDSTE